MSDLKSTAHPALNWLRSSAGARIGAAVGRSPLLREVAWLGLRQQILDGRYPFTRCFFIRQLKAIFIGIPKVATTSLYDLLSQSAGLARDLAPEGRHALPGIPDVFVRKFPEYFVFSFVRNPWNRVLSCYRYMIEEPRRQGMPMREVFRHRGQFHQEMEFGDFCLAVADTPDADIDVHLKSQCHLLRAADGRWMPEFVGRLENFGKHISVVAARLGIDMPARLPKRNTTDSTVGGSAEYRSAASREAIGTRYAEDIKTFEYNFPF